MIGWFFNNAQTLMAIVEFFVIAVGGFFIFTGVIGGKSKEIHQESDGVQQTLINNYRTLIEDQNKKIQDLTTNEILAGREISHLQGQVKTLTEILQGKDPKMQVFLTAAPHLVEIAEENNKLAKETAQSMKMLVDTMERFINNLPPMTPTITP